MFHEVLHSPPDTAEPCWGCRGRGVLLLDHYWRACWVCGGIATAGVFVVEVSVGSQVYGLARCQHGRVFGDFAAAVAYCRRSAHLMGLRSTLARGVSVRFLADGAGSGWVVFAEPVERVGARTPGG